MPAAHRGSDAGPTPVSCRFCRSTHGELVVDLGSQPACDFFPLADEPAEDPTFPVRVWLCFDCRLAQLAEDPTIPEEVRGIEPAAVVEQARDAVALVAAAGLLPLPAAGTVIEHGSPHGGSWLDLLAERGLRPARTATAEVVLDCFGLMHEHDVRAAVDLRAGQLTADGVLLLQYHPLATVIEHGQWNSFRHGHPAYLSTPTLVDLLKTVGLGAVRAWQFDLYGGTVLLAARRGGTPDTALRRLIDAERRAGVGDPTTLRGLERTAIETSEALREWLRAARASGRNVVGYGAASRAVPLLNVAKIGPDLLPVIADASAAKHRRRIPGAGIPIVSVEELIAREPDHVVLFVPDLLDEVRGRLDALTGGRMRWVVAEPFPRVLEQAAHVGGPR